MDHSSTQLRLLLCNSRCCIVLLIHPALNQSTFIYNLSQLAGSIKHVTRLIRCLREQTLFLRISRLSLFLEHLLLRLIIIAVVISNLQIISRFGHKCMRDHKRSDYYYYLNEIAMLLNDA